MDECKATVSPVDLSSQLVRSNNGTKVDAPFREAVGALMHLMTATRPDIAFAVGYVSRFMENPQQEHWVAVKSASFATCKAPIRTGSATNQATRSTFEDTPTRTGPATTLIASRLQAMRSCCSAHPSAGKQEAVKRVAVNE